MSHAHAPPARILFAFLLLPVFTVVLFAEDAPSGLLSFEKTDSCGNDATFQAALGDLDGDGDLDVVFANMKGRSELWLNDGSGDFSREAVNIGGEAHGVGIGDWDGDGDQDLVLTPASRSEASRIYFNDGSGALVAAETSLDDASADANSVAVFDVEGDGDLDLGVYYCDGQRHSRLYVNDGSGQFRAEDLRLPGLVSWGDIDGDGDIDAVGLQHQQNGSGFKVFENTGTLEFVESQHLQARGDFFPGSSALGDMDGDGDLDLVASGGPSRLTVLLNDGAGNFSISGTVTRSLGIGRLTLGDFDGDGVVDVLLGYFQHPRQIALGDREGGFSDTGLLLGPSVMPGMCAVGDLDGDGNLDLFLADYGGGPNEVWLNTMGE